MHLMTPKAVECSAHYFIIFFGSNQKSLLLKMARDMANLINAMFCDIT